VWWERAGLDVRDGRLSIAGRDAESLAREHGTPLYVYDLVRIEEQAIALRDALDGAPRTGALLEQLLERHAVPAARTGSA